MVAGVFASCADHDDPQLAPIDTTQVKITATVKDEPNSSWMSVSEEMTISVSDIEMTAPKGVVLRTVSLVANNGLSTYLIDDKPFSGQPMEFKVPLVGRHPLWQLQCCFLHVREKMRNSRALWCRNWQ